MSNESEKKKSEIKQEAGTLDIEVAPLAVCLTRPSSFNKGITIRQGLSLANHSLLLVME